MTGLAVKKLPKNTKGRDFVVGDIHGCFSLFEEALEAVSFDPKKDRVIAIGDLVNRGPESEKALSFLQKSWFHAIRGNHDHKVIQLIDDLDANQGNLQSDRLAKCYRLGAEWILRGENTLLLPKIKRAFNRLPYAIEIEGDQGKIGFVHAEIPQGLSWDDYKEKLETSMRSAEITSEKSIKSVTLWGRKRITSETRDEDSGVEGLRRLYVGHTPNEYGCQKIGNIFYIDTAAVFSVGALTITDITADEKDILRPLNPNAGKKVNAILANG